MLPRFSILLPCLAILSLVCAEESRAQESPAARLGGRQAATEAVRLIVLKNGEVIRGQVQSKGDRIAVTMPGREVSLRQADVDVVADSLDEAYQQKRAKLAATDIAGGLDMALWCLRHSLWEHAATELAMVRTRQPHEPRLAQLERRLQRELAGHASAKTKDNEQTAPAAPSSQNHHAPDVVSRTAETLGGAPTKSWPPATQPVVRAATKAANDEKKDSPVSESPAALDRFVRSLPTEAVEQFTNTLQPLIVNGCAAAACHAPTSNNDFTLLRLSPGKPATRRLTQRNLYNTVQLVDFSDPAKSPLLKVAGQPHGPLKAGVFDQRSPKYRDLEEWIARITRTTLDKPQAGDNAAVAQTSTDGAFPREADKVRRNARNHTDRFPGSVQQATFESPEPNPSAAVNTKQKTIKANDTQPSGRSGKKAAGGSQEKTDTPDNRSNNRWPPTPAPPPR